MPRGIKGSGPSKKIAKKGHGILIRCEDGQIILNEVPFNRLLRFESELIAAESQLTLKQIFKVNFLQKVDPQGVLAKLDSEINQLTVAKEEATQSANTLRTDIEKELSDSLNNYSLDDRTGVLHRVLTPEEELYTKII